MERRRGGLSDDFLVEARLKLVGGWRRAGRMEGARNVLKVNELNHGVKERAYPERRLSCQVYGLRDRTGVRLTSPPPSNFRLRALSCNIPFSFANFSALTIDNFN